MESNQRMTIEAEGYESVSRIIKGGVLHNVRMSTVRSKLAASTSAPELLRPSQAVAPAIMSAESPPKLSGRGKRWSDWYRVGVGKAPHGYTLQRVEFWLSGDRSCGSGAECRKAAESDRDVVWEFRLQGHEGQGVPGQTYSVAHIRVLYRAK
jgi:hypothetical protein